MNTKKLTPRDVMLLFSEGWLTVNKQSEFNIYDGVVKTRGEIERICPDQTVINSIFRINKVQVASIVYKVVSYYYGEQVNCETFNSLYDAIIRKENLDAAVKIEVEYTLEDD